MRQNIVKVNSWQAVGLFYLPPPATMVRITMGHYMDWVFSPLWVYLSHLKLKHVKLPLFFSFRFVGFLASTVFEFAFL